MDAAIVVAAGVQALSAVIIAFLTLQLVKATNRYVAETSRIVEENRDIARSSSQALFIETLPVLALASLEEMPLTEGTWKNVGRGPAMNVELAYKGDGYGGGLFPNEGGDSALEHARRVTLVPGDQLVFRVGGKRVGGIFLARYDDVYGNRYLSSQRTGWNLTPLRVSRIEGDQWDEGTPLTDVIARYGPE